MKLSPLVQRALKCVLSTKRGSANTEAKEQIVDFLTPRCAKSFLIMDIDKEEAVKSLTVLITIHLCARHLCTKASVSKAPAKSCTYLTPSLTNQSFVRNILLAIKRVKPKLVFQVLQPKL